MRRQIPYWTPKWSKIKGSEILRVPGSQFAALPTTGKKNARVYSIFNVVDLIEIIQLRKKEVSIWLAKKAQQEKVKPTGYIEALKPAPKRKAIATPQIGGVQPKPLKRNPKFKSGPGASAIKTRTHSGIVTQNKTPRYLVKAPGKHKGVVKRAVKKNPVKGRSMRKAVALYKDFTGHNPQYVDEWQVVVPSTALQVGHVTGILYKTKMDGKIQEFLHEFTGKSRPILAASADGRQLLLLGGDYKFTERGIVDGSFQISK